MIVWLASYPKSGNTWLRAFLANMLSDADEPVDINRLSTGWIASARVPFDELAGVEASDLTPAEIERLRPKIYLKMAEEAAETTYHKVHDAYTLTDEGRPLLPPSATLGAFYILRNPLDVAVSYAHHARSEVEPVIAWMADETHCFCSGPKRLFAQLQQRLSSWSGHVLSWVERTEFPMHVLRYEDMKNDPEATFTAAATFAGLPDDSASVQRALEFCAFEELQRQEAEHGFDERSPRAESFFRKGEVGSWREQLSAAQAERIVTDHREVMARFGYLDAAGEPIF